MMCNINSFDDFVANHIKLFSEPPILLTKICDELGIEIYTIDAEDDFCGEIKYDMDTRTFEIYVNNKHSDGRQRFTIAHELAHFFIHNNEVKILGISDSAMHRYNGKRGQVEREANELASKILMPKDLILTHIKDFIDEKTNDINIARMAQIFRVSESAMGYRLINLGIL